jgi:hypothetical protein
MSFLLGVLMAPRALVRNLWRGIPERIDRRICAFTNATGDDDDGDE